MNRRTFLGRVLMNAQRQVLLCLCALVAAAPARAAQGPPKPDGTRPEAAASQPSASLVFERQMTRVRFERDGTGVRELTMQIKVNDDPGVRQAGHIPLTYAPSSDDLAIAKLEVRKRDGSVITVGPEAVQEHAIQPYASSTMFLDLKQKLITVPSLQPGDTIFLTATWTMVRPIIDNHGWFEYSFIDHAIVDDERLEIDLPASLPAVVRVATGAPAERNGGDGEVVGQRRIYRWQTANAEVKDPDKEEAPDEAPPPDVRVTTFKDWAALAGWFRPLLHPAPDAAVRAKVAEVTKGLTDRPSQVQAIYDYVATQIRYVSLSFGVGRFKPHAPADVLKNQYGDCKDKHGLLAAMLDVIGVEAVAVLINTERSISEDVPSPAEFDHVITAIPSADGPSGWTWLDTTAEVAPFGMLAGALRDKRALFVGGEARPHRVVTTPLGAPFPFINSVDMDGEITPLGVLVANVRLRFRGDAELLMRSAVRAMPGGQKDEFGKGFAESTGFKGVVSGFAASDPVATREPFEITFTLRRGGFLDWAAATATLNPTTSPLHLAEQESNKDRRIGAPAEERRRFTVTLPPGYSAVAPVGVTVNQHGLEYRSAYRVDGQRLVAERMFASRTTTLSAKHAADIAALARTLESDQGQKFTVRREKGATPPIPGDMSVDELYCAGYSAYDAADHETAIAIWQRGTEVDPKHASTWSGLGFAYQRLKRYDEAIAAMEKQIELKPGDKRVHTDLGYVARQAGRLDVAARAYAKHVELNPLDGAVHKTLGEIYGDLGQHDKAVAALETAAPLLKDDEWLQLTLGSSLLATGAIDKAKAAFDRAVAIRDTPAVWTKVAWELADHGVDRAHALELLNRSTMRIAEATASVTAASADEAAFDLMERLAWTWDAKGMLAVREKNVERAIQYFEAAWRLRGHWEIAQHLGEAYEAASHRTADALSAYLMAHAVTRNPPTTLLDAITRLSGGIDIEQLERAAKLEVAKGRAAVVQGNWPTGTATFVAILDSAGKPVEAKWIEGDEALRDLETKMLGIELPLVVPDRQIGRVVVKLQAVCGSMPACAVMIKPPRAQ
jgi:tetratricopeptide (TPR) repeat protein